MYIHRERSRFLSHQSNASKQQDYEWGSESTSSFGTHGPTKRASTSLVLDKQKKSRAIALIHRQWMKKQVNARIRQEENNKPLAVEATKGKEPRAVANISSSTSSRVHVWRNVFAGRGEGPEDAAYG